MKSIMRFFSIATLAAAMATMVGCAKEETSNTNGLTFTTTVQLPGGGGKAIDGDGHKTFVEGDFIRLYEQLPSGKWSRWCNSYELTADDISADGKAARFSFPAAHVPSISTGTTLRFVYPGEYVDEVNETNGGSGIHRQGGGTLENLGRIYDYAKYDTTFTSNGQFPSRIKLKNQYAILKLIIKNSAGTDITSSITKLDITNSDIPDSRYTDGNCIWVERGEDPGPIYIAMYPTSDDIEFSTSNENYNHGGYYFTRTKTVTGKTLQAGHMYPVELTMPSTNVTLYSEDITKIGHDGYGYMGGIYVAAEGGATWTGTDGGNGPTVITGVVPGETYGGTVSFTSNIGKITRIEMTGFTKSGNLYPGWTESAGAFIWSGTAANTVYLMNGLVDGLSATLTAGDNPQIVFTVE